MLNKKSPLTGDSVTTKEPAAIRCEWKFKLYGDSVQCSQPAGHAGDHYFEVPPLPGIGI
jgi:hypothetical protein